MKQGYMTPEGAEAKARVEAAFCALPKETRAWLRRMASDKGQTWPKPLPLPQEPQSSQRIVR